MRKLTRKAFTLIEVMVVLLIIGILVALVAPKISTYIRDAKIRAAETEIRTIVSALTSYYSTKGEYPSSLYIIARDYLQKAKLNENKQLLDPWNIPYGYKVNDTGGIKNQRFSLTSAGADNIHASKDDISEEGGSTSTQDGQSDEFDESLESDLLEEEFE